MTDPKNQPVDNMTAHNESDDATSRNRAVADIITKRTGLLDLPPEIRLMIFRHVLVYSDSLPLGSWSLSIRLLSLGFGRPSRHFLSLLATSRLIRREARDVFYKENWFDTVCFTQPRSLTPVPQITDMIQNIYVRAIWNNTVSFRIMHRRKFLKLTKVFGDPSIPRGTLSVEIFVISSERRTRDWLIQTLAKFLNFRTIELLFTTSPYSENHDRGESEVFDAREYLRTGLEPVLGCAEIFEKDGYCWKNLRFHPIDNRNPWKTTNGDWVDSLDGGRLEWNENPTAADDFETPVND